MGSVIGAVFGLGCFYFWLTGWWFAAVVVWLGLAVITDRHTFEQWAVNTAIAVAPVVVRLLVADHRARERLRISLTNPRDASF